ncbi:MAG: hypothetical protein QOK29_748 [Rhodospirillaceae bacterium]|nr:hypothetical protein [Rhodospirillaceae bacterium]
MGQSANRGSARDAEASLARESELARPARGEQADSSEVSASPSRSAAGPRIYNLFPLLVGPIEAWVAHLPRIAAMGFDWVYVNSFHLPGASGSLYAVGDPYRLNPKFRGTSKAPDDDLLAEFIAAARRYSLRVMMDLSIGYLAADSALVREHPQWFRWRPDGALLNPGAPDAQDSSRWVIWQDMAALAYEDPAVRGELTEYWARYLRHYKGLGFEGFVCKSADRVPAEVWRTLIDGLRTQETESCFVADALGAPPEQVEGLAGIGFDYLFNSAKWWDFRSDWLLEQHERLRHIAPSITFAESHETDRLAAVVPEQGADLEARLKFQLLFAASFSAGWMMPIGCEYGFKRRLDPVRTDPRDWEEPQFDLTGFIAAVNTMRASHRIFDREGSLRRITPPGNVSLALLRLAGGHPLDSDAALLLLLNPDNHNAHRIDSGLLLTEPGGRFHRFIDMTPFRTPTGLEGGRPLVLEPLEMRVFYGEADRDLLPYDEAASQQLLRTLAEERIAIETVSPEINCGRHPVKRIVGDLFEVTADIFTDGHDQLAACVRYKTLAERSWHAAPMSFVDNDRWAGRFPLTRNTTYLYTIEAWRDPFASWRAEFVKKREAGRDVRLELREGLELIHRTAQRIDGPDRDRLAGLARRLEEPEEAQAEAEPEVLSQDIREMMARHGARVGLTRYTRDLSVIVDRLAARFSAWYELFPRSQGQDPKRSGTFDNVIRRLPYVQELGFDVLYFTPIHPIGRTNRKGRNNSLAAAPDDPGSPYAIGSEEGGHTAIHSELGTLDDFHRLVRAAHDHGLEIALDFAVQSSMDHPWIREHPEWFDWRPDGSIKYAENPPKKYEDIVNVNFDKGMPELWYALRDVVLFWIEQGVKIFRVDNPHTKPIAFWEWMIADIRARHPETIFLSEAFTRPKMMKKLAKVGFNQSYTYFTWRNAKQELIDYLTELCQGDSREYLRPNFFVNTPDINPLILQTGGRPAFIMRAVLAATLSSAYGIYSGYEVCEAAALPGREEYLDAEKYEIKHRNWDQPGNIRGYIARLNRIRRDNPALHDFWNLRFYNAYDGRILLYGKMTPSRDNAILVAVNLDPHSPHGCPFEVPLWEFGLPDHASLQVEDLLGGGSFWWQGKIQQLWLDPATSPAAIWRLTPPDRRL